MGELCPAFMEIRPGYPVTGIRVQSLQPNVVGFGVGGGIHQHKAQQGFRLVFGNQLPGGAAAQPVVIALPNQVLQFMEPGDLSPDGFFFLCRQSGGVQLIAEGARHGNGGPGADGGASSGLVVGRGGYVGTHGRHGIAEGGAVLDGQPGNGIGVVAAPDLGAVGQCPGIEPSTAAGAALKEYIGEFFRQPLHQVVVAQHEAVAYLPLPGSRKGTAVDIRQIAVKIPLDIVDGILPQKPGQNLIQPVHHVRPAHVQHQLAAAHGGLAPGHRQRPVGVGTVEIRVLADHLRLHPQAHLQAQIPDFSEGGGQPVREFLFMGEPVAKAAEIVVPASEPAVVNNEQLHAQILRPFGNGKEFFFGNVHVRRFPAVQQHRSAFQRVAAAADMVLDKSVIGLGQLRKTLVREGHQNLRGFKGFARFQRPAEALIMNAHDGPDGAGLVKFNIRPVVAGVHQHHAIALPKILGGGPVAEDHEGIVLMAGYPPGRGNGLNTVHQVPPLHGALHGVPPVEVEQLPVAKGQIQAGRCRFPKLYHSVSGVFYPNRPGDDVFFGKDAVQQLHLNPGGGIPQRNGKRLGLP